MPLPDVRTNFTTLEEQGDLLIVNFKMRLINDEQNIEQLGQELFSLVDQHGRTKLALDMSSVDYLTSSVLGKLITPHRKLHRHEGRVVLFGLTEGVHTILNTSKLLSYFTVTNTKDEALALLA